MKVHPHEKHFLAAAAFAVADVELDYVHFTKRYGQSDALKDIFNLAPHRMERSIAKYMALIDKSYRNGETAKQEKDIVHERDAEKSFEVRCSISYKSPYAVKDTVRACRNGKQKEKNTFMLFVSVFIDPNDPKVSIREVSCGYVKPTDWKLVTDRAVIDAPTKAKLFRTFYTEQQNFLNGVRPQIVNY